MRLINLLKAALELAAENVSINVAEEMNIPFPKPFVLQMDNEVAKCFARNSCTKTKLKRVGHHQEWVKILRDKKICTPVHVASADNLADTVTEILRVSTFVTLRDMLVHDKNQHIQ